MLVAGGIEKWVYSDNRHLLNDDSSHGGPGASQKGGGVTILLVVVLPLIIAIYYLYISCNRKLQIKSRHYCTD